MYSCFFVIFRGGNVIEFIEGNQIQLYCFFPNWSQASKWGLSEVPKLVCYTVEWTHGDSGVMNDESNRRIPTTREYRLGVTLCVAVSVIWVLSGELSQHMLGSNRDFEKKSFLFTYLSTTVFFVLLVGFGKKSWRERLSASPTHDAISVATTQRPLTVRYSIRVAAAIAPLYFLANWMYNAALELTSVSSASTMQNTSSLFAFLISVALRMERFAWRKLMACVITIVGTTLITQADGDLGTLLGDALSLFSAFLFAVYTTILQVMVPSNGDMVMIFAFVGALILLFGWCFIPLLSLIRIETFVAPSLHSVGIVLLNAIIGFVLADLLWAKSIVLTSSFVGNTATSLTVPISLLFDCWFKGFRVTPAYAFGALLVVVGSAMVSITKAQEDATKRSKSTVTV